MLNDLNQIRDQHQKAVDIAQHADHLMRRNQVDEAHKLYREAFELESEAAQAMPDVFWRPVYLCSAAVMGLRCGEYQRAEQLAALGLTLASEPHVMRNLREVLSQLRVRIQMLPSPRSDEEPLIIQGVLQGADVQQPDTDYLSVVDAENETWLIVASSEIINKTVRELWNQQVEVTGLPINGRVLRLIEIHAIEPVP